MYTIVYKPSLPKIITIIVVCIIGLVVLCQFMSLRFQHGTIASVLVVTLLVVAVVRAVGFFVMYPGTYRYLTAQVQKNQNDHLLTAIHKDLTALQQVCTSIHTKKLLYLKSKYLKLYGSQLPDSLRTQLNILVKGGTKSQTKLELIQAYQQLIKSIEAKVSIHQQKLQQKQFPPQNEASDNWISIEKILRNPSVITKIQNQFDFLCIQQISQTCRTLCMRIWELCTTFVKIEEHFQEDTTKMEESTENFSKQRQQKKSSPIKVEKSKVAHWLLHKQKLFTINSYFVHWDKYFVYSLCMVPVGKGNYIECAIIHKQKKKKQQPLKQAVLFNNPNGALFQSLALSSSYMNFYLQMGFQIVLWNYRGYANSTGFATVKNCIQDAHAVYKYVTSTYCINVQIIHGYSIGGIAAINLVNRVNSGSSRSIKLLVADRTLSSIDRVAVGFAKNIKSCGRFLSVIAKPIVWIFFHSECIDNSRQFLACQCDKLIIYDIHDEVICNSASLKFSIQQYALANSKIDPNFNQCGLIECVHNFANSSANLYKSNQKSYEKVMRILYDMDGAGKFPHFQIGAELENGKVVLSRQQIVEESQQYLTGLILYGPKLCLPYYKNAEQEQNLTLTKIQRKIKLLQEYEAKLMQIQSENRKQVITIIQSLIYAKEELKTDRMKEKNKIFGSLIVTEVGHNSQLKQWWQLERVVRRTVLSDQNIRQS